MTQGPRAPRPDGPNPERKDNKKHRAAPHRRPAPQEHKTEAPRTDVPSPELPHPGPHPEPVSVPSPDQDGSRELERFDDLVALTLGALAPAEAEALEADLDDAERAECRDIQRHLDLHDEVPAIAPPARIWSAIEGEIQREPLRQPSLLSRFWMPMAAAALVMIALIFPSSRPNAERIHGTVTATDTNGGTTYRADTISRIRLTTGTVVTMDADTEFELQSTKRLALRAGRIYVDAPSNERGFVVDAGPVLVETLGTVFSVERGATAEQTTVGVTRGSVRCAHGGEDATVQAGETWTPGAGIAAGGANRNWFHRPSLSARIEDVDTMTITVTNSNPDTITLAPPTGGEPFFFVRLGDDSSLPIEPNGTPLPSGPRTLPSGESFEIQLRLPRSLRAREAFLIACPTWGVSVEANRE